MTTANTADPIIYAKNYGAVFDGNSHPLSQGYKTLAAAKLIYPNAIALTDEIDGVATQAAINFCTNRVSTWSYGGVVMLPTGRGCINQPLAITKPTVSLTAPSPGFLFRSNTQWFYPSCGTALLWTGLPRQPGQGQVNMLTCAANLTDNRLLSCVNITNIMFDCNFIQGVAGPVFLSVRESIIDIATHEPCGIWYANSAITINSQTVTVSTTDGVRVGESIVGEYIPEGAYVAAIVDTQHLTMSVQATATATETVTIGGEGIRFDVVSGLTDSNDTQDNEVSFHGQSLTGVQYATAPLVMIGGSGSGSGGSGTHFGNTSLNKFKRLWVCRTNGVGIAINNSDHNYHEKTEDLIIGNPTASFIVLNGSLDPNNGYASDHHFHYVVGGAINVTGTNTGGFTYAAQGHKISWLDTNNGTQQPIVGVGASIQTTGD